MRHPARVYESWVRRRKNLEMLNNQFRNMVDIVHPHNPMYLVIDHEGRDERLKEINNVLGTDLKTDWSVWTLKNTSDIPITGEMINRVPGFVTEFYENIIDERHSPQQLDS